MIMHLTGMSKDLLFCLGFVDENTYDIITDIKLMPQHIYLQHTDTDIFDTEGKLLTTFNPGKVYDCFDLYKNNNKLNYVNKSGIGLWFTIHSTVYNTSCEILEATNTLTIPASINDRSLVIVSGRVKSGNNTLDQFKTASILANKEITLTSDADGQIFNHSDKFTVCLITRLDKRTD